MEKITSDRRQQEHAQTLEEAYRRGDEIAVPDPWGNILLLTPKSLSVRELASQ